MAPQNLEPNMQASSGNGNGNDANDAASARSQKLVSTMLFLSNSKLAIKLRYILALYRVEKQGFEESIEDCGTRIQEQIQLIENSIKDID